MEHLENTDPEVFDFLMGRDHGVLTAWLAALWAEPGNTFSHDQAVVAVRGGEPIVGFPPGLSNLWAMVLAAATIGLILWAMARFATRKDEA